MRNYALDKRREEACLTFCDILHRVKTMEATDTVVFTIEIQNQQPVELVDLTNSLLSLADEYKRFSGRQDVADAEDVRLYIKEIRSGSIIADLMAVAPGVLPYVGYATNLLNFSIYLGKAYNFLVGRSVLKPAALQKVNYENLSSFVEPVAKDNASQLNCHTTINGNVTYNLNITSLEANAVQNRAKREISLMKEPIARIKEKVLLYWYQARNDPKSKAGDKAIIENIQPSPVKVIFDSDHVKSQLIYGENPFLSAYIVDVEIETIKDKPVVYKVLNVHERIDRPPESKEEESENAVVVDKTPQKVARRLWRDDSKKEKLKETE
jgi:hypothetical protein